MTTNQFAGGNPAMRRALFVAICCTCVCFSTSATDEKPAWTAWLHYGRHMTLIDSNGDTLREFDLPIPDGYNAYYVNYLTTGGAIAVSNSGRWMAGLMQTPESTNLLIIYDMVSQKITATYAPPQSSYALGFSLSREQIFNEDETALAFGYHTLDGESNIRNWHIVILRLSDGKMLRELNSQDDYVQNLDFKTTIIPTVAIFHYRRNEISFTIDVTESSGSGGQIYAFIWNTITGEIREDIAHMTLFADTFVPTGEVVTPLRDTRFKDSEYNNTLQIFDPITQSRYPFYAADLNFSFPMFVQNGERILIKNVREGSFDLIDRNGTSVSNLQFSSKIWVADVAQTPQGFIYMPYIRAIDHMGVNIPALYSVDTRNGLSFGKILWQMKVSEYNESVGNYNFPLDIAWVHSDEPVGPFKPWAQLAEPVCAPTPPPSNVTITPTLIPTPPPLFHAGQTVRVQTIDGEILNLRAEPTRKSEIVVYIEDDTHLELLEGPVEAEGFSWWRVRLPDGLEGWVVENDGELQTLMPHSP
jgi:hypothetical protein